MNKCRICGIRISTNLLCSHCRSRILSLNTERCLICGQPRDTGDERGCWRCRQRDLSEFPDKTMVLCSYQNEGREVIRRIKFQRETEWLDFLSELFLTSIERKNIYDYCVIAPYHSTSKRRQTPPLTLYAKRIAKKLGIPYQDLLFRKKGAAQKTLSRDERLINLEGKIDCYPQKKALAEGKSILLIDDVMTTGSTLKFCTTALKKSGAKRVEALVWASDDC